MNKIIEEILIGLEIIFSIIFKALGFVLLIYFPIGLVIVLESNNWYYLYIIHAVLISYAVGKITKEKRKKEIEMELLNNRVLR